MHLQIILALFCLLGQTFVNGDGTSPAPAGSTAPPEPAAASGGTEAPVVASAVDGDIGLGVPGAPDINSCSDKNPCPDKNSKCIDGRCLCNDGYAPGGNDTCIKSPDLGDPCRVKGQEFSCAGFGVDYLCPPNGTVCVCRAGYDPDPKNNGACKPADREVGATCAIDGDCTAAFTTCQSGKCACIEGFKTGDKSTLCTPTDFKCFGNDKAIQDKGSVRLCEISVDPNTGEIGNDTCPDGSFCNNWQNSLTTTRAIPGHCCPKPTSANQTLFCPVGVAHKTGQCPDLSTFPADAPLPTDLGPLCPLGSGYECFHGRICCPLACRSSNSHFNVDGKCYDSVIIDQPCLIDAQCLPGSECSKGTCQCKKDFKKVSETYCLPPGETNPFAPGN